MQTNPRIGFNSSGWSPFSSHQFLRSPSGGLPFILGRSRRVPLSHQQIPWIPMKSHWVSLFLKGFNSYQLYHISHSINHDIPWNHHKITISLCSPQDIHRSQPRSRVLRCVSSGTFLSELEELPGEFRGKEGPQSMAICRKWVEHGDMKMQKKHGKSDRNQYFEWGKEWTWMDKTLDIQPPKHREWTIANLQENGTF